MIPVSFDCETELIRPGVLAPRLVCASIAIQNGDKIETELLDKHAACEAYMRLLRGDRYVIVGANIPYDNLVMAVAIAKLYSVDVMPLIFKAYDEGRIFDVQVAQALDAIALGCLGRDPLNPSQLITAPGGKRTGRYSLAVCVDQVLGRDNAKVNDEWRLRYGELIDVPIADWPEMARLYPLDDALNTLECGLAQMGKIPRDTGNTYASRNIHNLPAQVYAHWAMHLGAAWGFTVDPAAVAALKARVEGDRAEHLEEFVSSEIIRPDGTKNTAWLKHLVAHAYGCKDNCTECGGNGKAKSATTGNPINCKACSGTGWDLDTADVPRTPTGGVQTGRDVLFESGDELLMNFAAFGEADKIRTVYVPYLEKGVGPEGNPIPINLRPNAVLASGRASYGDVIQQLPRRGGVRECFVARPGWVLASCDWSGVELATHAQSCLWTVGYSEMANALNAGVKVHDALGARMAGVGYEEFVAEKGTNKFFADCRDVAKAGNFGFMGGMGELTLVRQSRKADTTTGNYRGLRFCLLIGNQDVCGTTKLTEYKGKPTTPVCAACVESSKRLRQVWFDQWPENRDYFLFVSAVMESDGVVEQHVSKRLRQIDSDGFCAAANSYFQGLAADGAKLALTRVSREQYAVKSSPLYGTRTILFAHDELIVESREEQAHDAAMRLQKIMVDSMREMTPDVVQSAEPVLMRRWYKGAEPVFENGRLVPWEP